MLFLIGLLKKKYINFFKYFNKVVFILQIRSFIISKSTLLRTHLFEGVINSKTDRNDIEKKDLIYNKIFGIVFPLSVDEH